MNRNEPHATPHAPGSQIMSHEDFQRAVDAASGYGLFPPIEVEILGSAPIVILVSPLSGESRHDLAGALTFITRKLHPKRDNPLKPLYRGVWLNRLDQVMSFGCDVTPTTAPLYASEYAKKAMEYGDLVMAFDPARLDKTFRKVPKSECPATLSRLKKEFPTVIEEDEYWRLSKLPPGDDRTGTIYESYYTFFIPGDPHEALLMIFLIGNDREGLRSEFLRCTGGTSLA